MDFSQYEDLYNEHCFVSTSKDISFSSFNVDIETSDFKFDGFYIFAYGYKLYIVNFESKYTKVGLDSNGSLYVNVWGSDLHPGYGEIQIKTMVYPFNSYYESFSSFFGDNYAVDLYETFKLYPGSNLTPIYHTTVIYDIVDGNFTDTCFIDYSLPYADVFGLHFDLAKPVEMYGGSISFDLTTEQLLRFKKGQYVFKFTNMGFIPFSDSYFAYPLFVLNVIDSGNTLSEQTVLINTPSICDVGNEEYTEFARAGSCNIDDYIVNWNNVFLGDSDGVYTCVLSFAFICDVGAAFFPGTVEIVEYEDFEDTLYQYEILDAIDASSLKLQNEIIDAAEKITGKLDDVKDGIDDASNKLSDKLAEVKDEITNKLTEIKDNLLDGIKSFFIPSDEVMEEIDDKWDELLKTRFGALYEVSDIISDFASEMSWDYVRNAGEKIR